MKVTLDISKLLEENSISQEEHDKFLALARRGSSKHALGILSVMGIIALVLGAIGLFPEFFGFIVEALVNIFEFLGRSGSHVLVFLVLVGAGVRVKSGFLVGISSFVVMSFLGGTALYTHATYIVAIQEPASTVVVFSLLALTGLLLSSRLIPDYERLAIIFSRTCLILVNLGFWVGSLWGSASPIGTVPDWVFSIVWAIGLLSTLVWGAKVGRLFVVNAAVSFGTIHFYTQWFEFLGANPLSLFIGGVAAVGLAYVVPRYNRFLKQQHA